MLSSPKSSFSIVQYICAWPAKLLPRTVFSKHSKSKSSVLFVQNKIVQNKTCFENFKQSWSVSQGIIFSSQYLQCLETKMAILIPKRKMVFGNHLLLLRSLLLFSQPHVWNFQIRVPTNIKLSLQISSESYCLRILKLNILISTLCYFHLTRQTVHSKDVTTALMIIRQLIDLVCKAFTSGVLKIVNIG